MKNLVFKTLFIYKHDRQSVMFILLFFLILIKIDKNQYKSKRLFLFFSCYILKF